MAKKISIKKTKSRKYKKMNVKVVMHDLIKLPSVTSLQTSSLSLGKFDLFIDS
jgi:hypothetical protein